MARCRKSACPSQHSFLYRLARWFRSAAERNAWSTACSFWKHSCVCWSLPFFLPLASLRRHQLRLCRYLSDCSRSIPVSKTAAGNFKKMVSGRNWSLLLQRRQAFERKLAGAKTINDLGFSAQQWKRQSQRKLVTLQRLGSGGKTQTGSVESSSNGLKQTPVIWISFRWKVSTA